jgi:hypothetical protein
MFTRRNPEPDEPNSTSSRHISLRSILILHLHQHRVLTNCILSSGFRTKIMDVFIISHMRATRLARIILLKSITNAGAEVAKSA